MTNTTTHTATVPAQHSTGSRVAYVLATWPADTIRRDVLRSFLAAGPVKHDPPTRTARTVVREGEEWVCIVDCAELRRRAALLPATWRDELDRRITRAAEQPPGRRP